MGMALLFTFIGGAELASIPDVLAAIFVEGIPVAPVSADWDGVVQTVCAVPATITILAGRRWLWCCPVLNSSSI